MANYDEDEWGLLNLGQVITTNCCASLHKASKQGHVDCVRSFINQGANIEERDDLYNGNMTPLLGATDNGHADCLRILIETGANIDAQDNDGETPLHLACKGGYFDCLDLLIKAGANMNIKDCDGYSALHKASQNRHLDCIRALIEAGVDVNLCVLRRELSNEIVQSDRQHIPTKGKGESALHLAIHPCKSIECVKFLISCGANVNARDQKGRTPLHYAIRAIYAQSVTRTLLEAGTDPLIVDHKNRTPKDLAILYNQYWQHSPDTFDLSTQFQTLLTPYEIVPISVCVARNLIMNK